MSSRRLIRRRSSRQAFTLVELLVVIGIIGLLVSILLPAVNRAREAAKTTVCASNLRQIGVAMNAYILDQRTLPPGKADAGGTIWPKGIFWSSHLVATKFISAPTGPGASKDHIFHCPSGSDEDFTFSGFSATSPRDPQNRGFIRVPEPSAAAAVQTWYALNCQVAENGGGKTSASNAVPFIWVKPTDNANFADGAYTRGRGVIKYADRLVMAFDGNAYNWNQIAGSVGQISRVSARHGSATNNGLDGFFNCLFFDGHVALLPSEPYTLRGLRAEPGVTIFHLNDQK
ncbi:type II secretion system protein [Humisphaera borealis]|uniref:DUF1559 domain-containing protein n=1 Tax=Humisphaera borealis TaxID=2807512 RepID=A0A7M2X4R3_9BACT|nr:DUF1559 domain-containing protein [Humisphaera borealis]QOV92041.1 DUF1559 domain-containing protein [Humisphaera borealis]